MDRFQRGDDKADAPQLFLLNMRAGVPSINSTDTVVLYGLGQVRSLSSCGTD
jgi:hypothetical protein